MNMHTTACWNEVEFVLLQCWAWRCHGDELQMLLVVVGVVRRQWWLQWTCSDQDCLRELSEDQETKERNYKSYEERGCKRCEKHFCPLICDTRYIHTGVWLWLFTHHNTSTWVVISCQFSLSSFQARNSALKWHKFLLFERCVDEDADDCAWWSGVLLLQLRASCCHGNMLQMHHVAMATCCRCRWLL